MPSKVMSSFGTSLTAHILLIVLSIVLVFSNTLENDYHLDSVYRVKANTHIDRFWPPSRFFTDVRTGSTIPQIAEYRPMMPLSNAINSEISQALGIDRRAGFHIGNIAVHIGTCVVLYFLFSLLLTQYLVTDSNRYYGLHPRLLAFFGTLIFAIHPIAGSAVNYLAARDLLLMVFFLLSSFLVYVRMRESRDTFQGWIFSLLLVGLAILSKQAAIMAFGFVFLFEWIIKETRLIDWRLWLRTAVFAIPTAGFFLMRWLMNDSQDAALELRTPRDFSYPITMLDAHLFYYLRNFVWPFEMRALARIEILNSAFHPRAMAGLLFILSSLVCAWFFRKKQPLITLCILSYWLFLSLTSSIFPFQYEVTDYRQYLSSAFLSLLVVLSVFYLFRKNTAIAITTSLFIYFAISSYYINTHWKTEESFWKQSIRYGADALAHQNYAMSVVNKDPDLAEFHYHEALKQAPHHIYANINLALLEIKKGEESRGLKRLERMIQLNPQWAMPYYWYSVALKNTGRQEDALAPALKAAELDTRSLDYQYHAAMALKNNGKPRQAIKYFERSVSIEPDYGDAEFWLAFMYQKTGQSKLSIETYNRFLGRNPDHVQSHFNLAYEQMTKNNCEDAIPHFRRVLELRPAYSEAEIYIRECLQQTTTEKP